MLLFKCRFAKVGNTAAGPDPARSSHHLHRGSAAGRSGMTGHAVDGAHGSWRLNLLRSVMGDSICETGTLANELFVVDVVDDL